MKKLICLILIPAMFLMFFAGCGSKSLENKTPAQITVYLEEQLKLKDLTEVSGDQFLGFFGFSASAIGDPSFLISSTGYSSDMIGAFKYQDDEIKNKIIEAIARYMETSANNLKAMEDEEYKKVQNRVLYEYENTIILVVCSNPQKAANLLIDLGASEIK